MSRPPSPEEERDIVERLHAACNPMVTAQLTGGYVLIHMSVVESAADEIERLRAAPSPLQGGDGTMTLHSAAQRLISLASKIERASSEAEENDLCDQRDRLFSMFRKADRALLQKGPNNG